jgi:hypothetical protein
MGKGAQNHVTPLNDGEKGGNIMKFEAYDFDPNSTLFLQEGLYKQAVVVAEACELAGLKEKEKTYRHLAAKHAEFIYKHIANRNETR